MGISDSLAQSSRNFGGLIFAFGYVFWPVSILIWAEVIPECISILKRGPAAFNGLDNPISNYFVLLVAGFGPCVAMIFGLMCLFFFPLLLELINKNRQKKVPAGNSSGNRILAGILYFYALFVALPLWCLTTSDFTKAGIEFGLGEMGVRCTDRIHEALDYIQMYAAVKILIALTVGSTCFVVWPVISGVLCMFCRKPGHKSADKDEDYCSECEGEQCGMPDMGSPMPVPMPMGMPMPVDIEQRPLLMAEDNQTIV